jgi:Ca2+-binding EF-hand superfamily protein
MSIGAISSVGSYGFLDRMVMNATSRTAANQNGGSDVNQIVSRILKKDDSDGDGMLAAGETKFDSSTFNKVDSNSDGKLSSDELIAGLENLRPSRPMRPPMGMQPPQMDASDLASKVLQSQDSDGDGALTVEETGLESGDFNTLDTDGDGSVSVDELTAGIEARQSELMSATPPTFDSAAASSGSDASTDVLKTLIDALNQNGAAKAYSSGNWVSDWLNSSSQNLILAA